MNWKIIYNNGSQITTASSRRMNWNDAPAFNVQYVIIYRCGNRKLRYGKDTYNINEVGSNPKTGRLLSNAEWRKTREFMIYGDY